MSERSRALQFEAEEATRLDLFLVGELEAYSRTRVQRWIKSGRVRVNGETVQKPGLVLDAPARVEVAIPPPAPSQLIPESLPLNVIFENEDLLVVDKPAGMVVHPSPGHSRGTLVHAALAHAPELEGVGGVRRPGVVHRLDKETSGVILLAKRDAAHHWLQEQFRSRAVFKEYLALVDGRPPSPKGRVEVAIGRDPQHRTRMAAVPADRGRRAVTEYLTRERFSDHTYLTVHPITGRTHQIRVHLAFLDCPVAGDTLYGRRQPSVPLERHFLHAARLDVALPGESEARSFIAPLPMELNRVLEALRGSH